MNSILQRYSTDGRRTNGGPRRFPAGPRTFLPAFYVATATIIYVANAMLLIRTLQAECEAFESQSGFLNLTQCYQIQYF